MSDNQNEVTERLGDYVAIDVSHLMNAGSHLPCDVFIKLSAEKMTRIFSKETGLDFQRLGRYLEKGTKQVFVHNDDYINFTTFLAETPLHLLSKTTATVDEQVQAMLDLAEQSITDFYETHLVKDETFEKTRAVVKKIVTSMGKEKNLLGMLLKMAKHHDYLIEHSLSVAIISMAIVNSAQRANDSTLELVGMGGFLHDLGKTKLDPSLLGNKDKLSAEQLKELRMHPKLGARMLEKSKAAPEEVRLIVLQHHEEPGGDGYPNGLRGSTIFYPAKVVAIANDFASMVSPMPNMKVHTADEALIVMRANAKKYDREILKQVIKLFGKKVNEGHGA